MTRSVGTAALLIATLVATLFALGCDKKDDSGSSAGGPSAPKDSATEALQAANEQSGGRLFDESSTKKACELLSPERVGETFGVPAAELRPIGAVGCTYQWESKGAGEPTRLDVRFSTIQVHADVATAKQWFANATKGMSQGEVKDAMAAVTRAAKEREEVDTKAKEKTVDLVGGAVTDAAGPGGFQFESVDGVGDEARLALSDGALWVRAGNLTFVISAYHGPPAPKPDLKGVGLQEMAKAALAADREWVKKTLSKRREDASKLVAVLLKALP